MLRRERERAAHKALKEKDSFLPSPQLKAHSASLCVFWMPPSLLASQAGSHSTLRNISISPSSCACVWAAPFKPFQAPSELRVSREEKTKKRHTYEREREGERKKMESFWKSDILSLSPSQSLLCSFIAVLLNSWDASLFLSSQLFPLPLLQHVPCFSLSNHEIVREREMRLERNELTFK